MLEMVFHFKLVEKIHKISFKLLQNINRFLLYEGTTNGQEKLEGFLKVALLKVLGS